MWFADAMKKGAPPFGGTPFFTSCEVSCDGAYGTTLIVTAFDTIASPFAA
jgi:hypothetical protein